MKHPDLKYLLSLAKKAGTMMREGFCNSVVTLKKDGTPLTTIDTDINTFVVDSISKDFPEVSVIGEEESRLVKGSRYTIVCDPIDGTIPYAWGIPMSTFVIALLDGWDPQIALIHDPFMRRFWWMIKDSKTCLNGKPIKVSQHDKIKDSRLGILWWAESPYNIGRVTEKLIERKAKWIAPASVCYLAGLVAMGHMDGIIFPESELWEAASMQLIVEGAGGKVTDILGNPLHYDSENGGRVKGLILSNGRIHHELVQAVRSCQ